MLVKEVGSRIRVLREEKLNMTQADFARKLGWDRTFLSRVERGIQNITLETFEKICDGLGVSVKEFFEE